ncbi:hypothetical protein F2Q69_00018203 [Brassica cretica]|uniref:Uncharacterized protein n=1 Tax=Brassica cretica TaxID=69181 RepID=A0A8S9QQZ9_BRACR|nr:hypothetical protein F2Q69_00018203 [Brassica cretica]
MLDNISAPTKVRAVHLLPHLSPVWPALFDLYRSPPGPPLTPICSADNWDRKSERQARCRYRTCGSCDYTAEELGPSHRPRTPPDRWRTPS